MAGRVLISNHQKNTAKDFAVIISRLYDYVDIHGNHHPLVSKKLFDIVMRDGDVIATWFRYYRDYLLDYF